MNNPDRIGISLVPENFLRALALSQEVDQLVHNFLRKWNLIPLTLHFPLSTYIEERKSRLNTQYTIHASWTLDGMRSPVEIEYSTDNEWQTHWWTISIKQKPPISIELMWDTQRQILSIIKQIGDIQKNQTLHRVSRNININWETDTLRYQDSDGNVYFLRVAAIFRWDSVDNSDINKVISRVYIEKDGKQLCYRVISSYQVSEWKKSSIRLCIIEEDILMSYDPEHLPINEKWLLLKNSIMSGKVEVITLDIDTLRSLLNDRRNNTQTVNL